MCKKDGIIIQEKKTGMEMAVGGYFGPHGWNAWGFENFENKKLMNGDLGPATGEMGTLVRPVKLAQSRLAQMVLLPFTKQLKALGYVGYVDNNCIITDDGTPWPLEWTMRDGWPLRHNVTSLVVGDQAQWMLDLVQGRDTLKVQDACSISVVMPLPPFPYQHVVGKDVDGVPIYGWRDREQIHLSEARLEAEVPTMMGDKLVRIPGMVCTDVYPLVITGTGQTISGARRSAYAAAKRVKIPNSAFYRTDIGVGRMVKQLPKLQKLGYARGLVL
jgi:phosphoribosylamine--glycine ligase